MDKDPHIIPVGQEPPPMRTPAEVAEREARRAAQPDGKAAGKTKDSPERRRTRDRFGVLNAFVDCGMADLTRAEVLTWLVLYRDTRDGTARTSATDVARRIGTSRRAVTDALAELRRRGLLKLVYRGGMNRGASVYRVHPLPRADPT
jgi:DNA-binding transcriptional ArsR family regulator